MPSKAESSRSSTPPTPGKRSPASFNAASRFSTDSIRSPSTANAAKVMPNSSAAAQIARELTGNNRAEDQLREHREHAAGEHATDRALDGLVRADRRSQLV